MARDLSAEAQGSMLSRAARTLLVVALAAAACALCSTYVARASGLPGSGAAPGIARSGAGAHSAVSLHLAVGYGNIYRGGAWTPVRVTMRNRGNADLTGTIEIPQVPSSATGAQPDFHGLYEAPVVLPAGSTKNLSLYVPGSGIGGRVTVRFLTGHTVLASASTSPIGLDTSALLIGVLAGSPGEIAWIAPSIERDVTTHVVRLDPAAIDGVSQALATFDLIVLTDVDTSQLDRAQIHALQGYVQNGGSILVVGGPAWQETLNPLQDTLLPGIPGGMRVLPDLNGLLPLVPGRTPRTGGAAAVSVLAHPTGTVMASQSGIPLVVRATEGQGTVEYLAFDPALSPIRGWAGASGLREHLLSMAAPLAISRTWSPTGFRARFQGLFRSFALTDELSNLPGSTLPFMVFFAALTLGYVLILGPVNFLLLRRVHRQSLAWVTIPVLGLACLGSILAITPHIRSQTAVLNSVGLVSLSAGSDEVPATFYMGLATPMSGTYHLTYGSAGLPSPLPQLSHPDGFSFRDASMLHSTPLLMRLREDPETAVTFLSMRRWSIRDLALDTSVHIPGAVQSGLTLDTGGNLAGPIHNGTNLDLLDPVVIAGGTIAHLPAIPAGGTIHARLRPNLAGFDQNGGSLLVQAYRGPTSSFFGGFGGFRDCCDGPSYAKERTLNDRVRNAAAMLSQAQSAALSSFSGAVLVGWTERALGTVSLDGSTPSRRDLTLVVTPLAVHFPARGSFSLRAGTVASRLVDILPRAPQSSCCNFGPGPNGGEVSVGAGGYLTFLFDLHANRHVRFQRLTLSVNSEDGSTDRGSAYDWRAHRWVRLDLSSGAAGLPDPQRFVSAQGQIMARVEGADSQSDLTISDPADNVVLSGRGAVA